ncbi:hypothetical protein XPA_002171 [Xanthoria parietina]
MNETYEDTMATFDKDWVAYDRMNRCGEAKLAAQEVHAAIMKDEEAIQKPIHEAQKKPTPSMGTLSAHQVQFIQFTY